MRRRKFLKVCTAVTAGSLLQANSDVGAGQESGGDQKVGKLFALTFSQSQSSTAIPLVRYGAPFLEAVPPAPAGGSVHVEAEGTIRRIFLLGMAESAGVRAWADPHDEAVRYFVEDKLERMPLAPFILLADYKGTAPEDDDPSWRAASPRWRIQSLRRRSAWTRESSMSAIPCNSLRSATLMSSTALVSTRWNWAVFFAWRIGGGGAIGPYPMERPAGRQCGRSLSAQWNRLGTPGAKRPNESPDT